MENSNKIKLLGYSNGKIYPISRLGKHPNTGWTQVEGMSIQSCCTFEKIEEIRVEDYSKKQW
jgi:hypothetical protein